MSLGDKKSPEQQTHRQAVDICDFPISRLVVSFNSDDQLVQVRGCQNCAAVRVTEQSSESENGTTSCEVGGGKLTRSRPLRVIQWPWWEERP